MMYETVSSLLIILKMQIKKRILFSAIRLAKIITSVDQSSEKWELSHSVVEVYWCYISRRQLDNMY